MNRLVIPGLLALLAPFAALAHPVIGTPATPLATGPAAIKTMLETLFAAIDSGDRGAAHGCLAGADSHFPMLVYDLDVDDRPIAVKGLEATQEFLDNFFDAMKKSGVKVKTTMTQCDPDCHSPELGYATLEFSQVFTEGGKSETRDYRATVLVTWGKDQSKGPKLFHWHASPAKAPEKAPPLPAQPAHK